MANFFDRVLNRVSGKEPKQEQRSLSVLRDAHLANRNTSANVDVTEDVALSIAAVYSCVRVLAETMASIPVHVYKRVGPNRELVQDHWLTGLLMRSPNPLMTAHEFKELMMYHLCLRGNFYAYIDRDANGTPVELMPLNPDFMHPEFRDNKFTYRYTGNSGANKLYRLEDIYHVKGLSRDGYVGMSPLKAHKEAFAHAYAAQQYGSRLFGNDARPGGVLTSPGELDDEGYDRLKETWEAAFSGANQHRVAILEDGMTFSPIVISPEEAQFIATRKLSRSEICGIFRVPPYMIADMEAANYSNIVQQDLAFSKHTLTPWCSRIEQAANLRLLSSMERDRSMYVKHNLDGIQRGDITTRYNSYGTMWDRGIMSANEIRALEEMNPIEHGDEYYLPMNFTPASNPAPAPFKNPNTPSSMPTRTEPVEVEQRKIEHRKQLGRKRQKIIRGHLPLLEDALMRVVRREKDKILAAARKNLRTKQSFEEFLEDFLQDTDYTFNQVYPVFEALGRNLGIGIMDEVHEDFEFTPALMEWTRQYALTFAQHHADSTKNQLRVLMADAEGDLLEILEERLESWTEGGPSGTTRAHKIGEHEAIRFAGALVPVVAASYGYTRYVWNAVDETCPICMDLDGRTVGIGEAFTDGNESNLKDANGEPFKPHGPVLQPPIHAGCDCLLSIET